MRPCRKRPATFIGSGGHCSQDAASGAAVQRSPDAVSYVPEPGQPSSAGHDLQNVKSPYKRKKVRVMVHGIRVWVAPESKAHAEKALLAEHATKTNWTDEIWKAAATKIMQDQFGAGVQGGDRKRKCVPTLLCMGSNEGTECMGCNACATVDLSRSPSPPKLKRAGGVREWLPRGSLTRPPRAAAHLSSDGHRPPPLIRFLDPYADSGALSMADIDIEPKGPHNEPASPTSPPASDDDITGDESEDKRPLSLVIATAPASDNLVMQHEVAPPHTRGADGMMMKTIRHSESNALAAYDHRGLVAFMQPTVKHADGMRFTPQPVVNFLYQAAAHAITVLQSQLGKSAGFNSRGEFLDLQTNSPASGGVVCAVWGTELGARRDQALIAWDYDVDLAVFKTADCDFARVWENLKALLEPFGLQCVEHSLGYKFRIAPQQPVAFQYWQARRHEAKLQNPGIGRAGLGKLAKIRRKHHETMQNPTGINCIDIEVHTVQKTDQRRTSKAAPDTKKPLRIALCGQKCGRFELSPESIFPIVEGVFGPLRIPLPRTPAMLAAEYGNDWGTERSMKVVAGNSGSTMQSVGAGVRRTAWPSIELLSCSSLLGGYWGAGLSESIDDVEWRSVCQ